MTTHGAIDFSDALPRLTAAYNAGVLVPFLGAGMSRDVCVDWRGMLVQLQESLKEARVYRTDRPVPESDPSAFYRIADELVAAVEAMPLARRANIYRKAIAYPQSHSGSPLVPAQSAALADVFWPLVISTNYDDVYWSAAECKRREPRVLGRTRYDCHRVLSTLDTGWEPVLWAIQGFVGGQLASPGHVVRREEQLAQLTRQVVIGHRQYQRAINDSPHFRRAFAEVYRRRTLWFLGSGIMEDYLINLLSEIRHHHGPNPRPHFACVKKGEFAEGQLRFLQTQLGIVPIVYGSHHDDLPKRLREFGAEAKRPRAALESMVYRFREGTRGRVSSVDIQNRGLPTYHPRRATIVSVGRTSDNVPIFGRMAGGFVGEHVPPKVRANSKWKPLDGDGTPSYVFRYGETAVFGVAARTRSQASDEADQRNLQIISEALVEGLKQVVAAGFEEVHVGMLASGRGLPWHPVYPFTQMLRGVKQFVEQQPSFEGRIVLYVVDPRLQMPLRAGVIPIAELLSSAFLSHRVEVSNGEGDFEVFGVMAPDDTSVGRLLEMCGLMGDKWAVEIEPVLAGREPVGADTVVSAAAVLRVRYR